MAVFLGIAYFGASYDLWLNEPWIYEIDCGGGCSFVVCARNLADRISATQPFGGGPRGISTLLRAGEMDACTSSF